jgi:solute carrier family 35 protein E1
MFSPHKYTHLYVIIIMFHFHFINILMNTLNTVMSSSSLTHSLTHSLSSTTKRHESSFHILSLSPPSLRYSSCSNLKTSTSLALSAAGGAKKVDTPEPASGGLKETLEITTYFALWYLFNIGYNIYNKQALNAMAFPWTIATLQMATGLFYFVPLWLTGLRKAPKLSFDDLKTLFPIALCHTGVHVGAVIALGAGAVSFAHIVKASEPVVTCALNALLLGQVLPLPVYATLLPIIGGVAIASMKELSFTVLALASAMLSNVSSAARGVLSKKTMSGKQIGENLDAQNLYAVLTAMSTAILIPLCLAVEGTGFFGAAKDLVAAGDFTNKSLATLLALGGASYYAYNEVAFLALGKVCLIYLGVKLLQTIDCILTFWNATFKFC